MAIQELLAKIRSMDQHPESVNITKSQFLELLGDQKPEMNETEKEEAFYRHSSNSQFCGLPIVIIEG